MYDTSYNTLEIKFQNFGASIYSATQLIVATQESFWLNFDIFLTTFYLLQSKPANQNMRISKGGDVKV